MLFPWSTLFFVRKGIKALIINGLVSIGSITDQLCLFQQLYMGLQTCFDTLLPNFSLLLAASEESFRLFLCIIVMAASGPKYCDFSSWPCDVQICTKILTSHGNISSSICFADNTCNFWNCCLTICRITSLLPCLIIPLCS